MNPVLKDAKRTIRVWIQQFSGQRLAEVYAFNADGKMSVSEYCCCLLGVTLAPVLHTNCGIDWPIGSWNRPPQHYRTAKAGAAGYWAEVAYHDLGFCSKDGNGVRVFNESLRQRRLSAILRGEIRRRELGDGDSAGLQHARRVADAKRELARC